MGTVPAVAAEVANGGVSAIVHTGDMAYVTLLHDSKHLLLENIAIM